MTGGDASLFMSALDQRLKGNPGGNNHLWCRKFDIIRRHMVFRADTRVTGFILDT